MFGSASSPFGQKPATTGSTGFGSASFGTPGASAFGTPQQTAFGQGSNALSFGQTTTTPAFGQTSTTPAFGQASTTPAFGQTPTTSAFGQSTTPAFGSPAPTTTPGFGAAAASSFGSSTPLTFGTNQQKAGFGATTQASLSFGTGATTVTQSTGFSFGTNLGQSSFGTTTTATTSSSLALGTSTTQSSLGFSIPSATATTTSAGLTFGGTKPGSVSFGLPTTTTTQSSLTFGSSLTSKPTASPGSTGFTFGTVGATPSTTTSAPTTVLSSGLSSFTSGGLSAGSTIGGKSMLTITGNTATPLYSTKSADLQAGRSPGQIPPKCQSVHSVVLELVESFKNHMKEQKHLCLEVSRASLKPISKISNDAESIKKAVMKLERAVNKNKLLNSKLKDETVRAVADLEVAQKAMDYPGGFPCDNSIITDYFLQLANKFQQQIVGLRVELESTEKSVLCELNPVAFTPQELSTTMQRLYECFVALAGRFQFVHAQISNLKVQHLELRKKKLEDYSDIFNKKNLTQSLKPAEVSQTCVTPSQLSGLRALNMLANRAKQLGENIPTTTFSPTAFGNTLLGSPLNQSLQNNNLIPATPQPVTPGSKRGKR